MPSADDPAGTPPAIVAALLSLDGRSARAISLAAGLSGDAVRNLLRGSIARPKTLAALARAFGVAPGVLTGTDPLPDALPRPAIRATSSAFDYSGPPDARRRLRHALSAAVADALAAGEGLRAALDAAVLAAVMAPVAAGLDPDVAAEIVDFIGG